MDWYTRVQLASVILQALLIGCYWYKRTDTYDVSLCQIRLGHLCGAWPGEGCWLGSSAILRHVGSGIVSTVTCACWKTLFGNGLFSAWRKAIKQRTSRNRLAILKAGVVSRKGNYGERRATDGAVAPCFAENQKALFLLRPNPCTSHHDQAVQKASSSQTPELFLVLENHRVFGAQGIRDQAGLLFFTIFYWSLIPSLTSTVLINQASREALLRKRFPSPLYFSRRRDTTTCASALWMRLCPP